MNDEQRHAGPSDAAPGLGRELARLGELRETSSGPKMRRILVTMVAILVITLGAAAVMVVLGLVLADIALVVTGLFVGAVCFIIFGLTAFVAYETLRSGLVLHENGIVAHQSFRGPSVIPWSEVAALLPPNTTGDGVAFLVGLNTGKRVGISRLKLQPQQDDNGAWSQHPDVALVIEHYAAWCRRHDRPVAIRR